MLKHGHSSLRLREVPKLENALGFDSRGFASNTETRTGLPQIIHESKRTFLRRLPQSGELVLGCLYIKLDGCNISRSREGIASLIKKRAEMLAVGMDWARLLRLGGAEAATFSRDASYRNSGDRPRGKNGKRNLGSRRSPTPPGTILAARRLIRNGATERRAHVISSLP